MKALRWRNTLLLIGVTTFFLTVALLNRENAWAPLLLILGLMTLLISLLFGRRGV
ncbi:MAG: hypothetical protein SFY81_06540 [Verrucomicrobiota bacterium]|nr:hypothetical protein [Verrucomicrobiota bacterium]